MSQAEALVLSPNRTVKQVAEHVTQVAEFSQSYAYQFMACEDGSFFEVRVPALGQSAVLTVVDEQGRPIGAPHAIEPPQPASSALGVSAPLFLSLPESESEPKKRRWKFWANG